MLNLSLHVIFYIIEIYRWDDIDGHDTTTTRRDERRRFSHSLISCRMWDARDVMNTFGMPSAILKVMYSNFVC